MIKPILAARDIVALPFYELEINTGRPASLHALEAALASKDRTIIVATQIRRTQDEIKDVNDLHEVAVLAYISSVEEMSGGADAKVVKVIPFRRVKLKELATDLDNITLFTHVEFNYFDLFLSDPKKISLDFIVLQRILFESKEKFHISIRNKLARIEKEYFEQHTNLPEVKDNNKEIDFSDNEIKKILMPTTASAGIYSAQLRTPIYLLSLFLNVFELDTQLKMKFLNTLDLDGQLEMVITIAKGKIHEQAMEREIEKTLRRALNKQQKQFLLREKLKTIQKELGDEDEESDTFEETITNKKIKNIYPKAVSKTIAAEKSRLKNMMASSPDANITRNYIDLLTALPWRKVANDTLDIEHTKKILERDHYGLKEVKERIIEYIAIMTNNTNKNPEEKKNLQEIDKEYSINLNLFKESDKYYHKSITNVPILALVGPPGTGKTSLSKSIAEALNKPFVKISLGGIKDESEIRGHRRTYVGAMPGKIITGVKKAAVSNPVILLDEIDKMASSYRGDPSSAMLEVLDPEQNHKFQDHYLELEYDLSKVLFIATANFYEDIPTPLLDRIEVIDLSSYTILEKVRIARSYLIAKVLKDVSLEEKHFMITDEMIEFVINHYTLEAGVRNLRRVLDKLARKIVVKLLQGKIKEDEEYHLTEKHILDLLGVIRFSDETMDKEPQIGAVNGLAYTAYGGTTLKIEVNLYHGKGDIKITGSLKDVMQESAQAAVSYVRANAEKFGITDFDWDTHTIHIHVPAGAIPKDGPSAGVTFTTAVISAVSKREVQPEVGMTGEITLRGKVLPIGGLKEKSIAAQKFGIQKVFIPFENKKDLDDIPPEVRSQIEFRPVKYYDEIYDELFGEHSVFKNTNPKVKSVSESAT